MPRTLRQNLGRTLLHTEDAILYIDRNLGHEVSSPQAFEAVKQVAREFDRFDQ